MILTSIELGQTSHFKKLFQQLRSVKLGLIPWKADRLQILSILWQSHASFRDSNKNNWILLSDKNATDMCEQRVCVCNVWKTAKQEAKI